jgi:pyruvate dehydrogenase E1 component alpha subunit
MRSDRQQSATEGNKLVVSERAIAAKPREELEQLLSTMIRIRRFEEKAAEMYARGKIKGFLHLYIGQEAVAAGVFSRLREDDYVYSHYREHGHAIARGLDSKKIMAELFGKATGVSRGLGGSMHIFDISKRFMGGYAIVAGHMPLACGTALTCQKLGTDSVTLCIIGDGAVNEGAFHESLNLAAVFKLPVLFLCENNFYGMGTAMHRVSAMTDIYKRAEAYGIRSEQTDGMDVLAMQKSTEQALQLIRRGEGPVFIEAITYRFRGHSMADPEFYRDKTEVEHWRQNDPITVFSEALKRGGQFTDAQIEAMWHRAEEEAEEAARFAEESPFPDVSTLMDHMYAPSPLDNLTEDVAYLEPQGWPADPVKPDDAGEDRQPQEISERPEDSLQPDDAGQNRADPSSEGSPPTAGTSPSPPAGRGTEGEGSPGA